jgi:hypothetical protein
MFLEKLKQKAAVKLLKKALYAFENDILVDEPSKIRSIGCIVNFDEFNHTEVFKELSEQIGLKANAYKIIGFSDKGLSGSGFTIPVFSEKDLGWNGKFNNGDIDEFLNRKYDLLINYYKEAPVILKLVSARANGRIKVGLLDENQELNHITFKIPPNSFTKFKDELIKYLRILNKI